METQEPGPTLEVMLETLESTVHALKELFAINEAENKRRLQTIQSLQAQLETASRNQEEAYRRATDVEKRSFIPQQAAVEHYAAYCREKARVDAYETLLDTIGGALSLGDWRGYDMACMVSGMMEARRLADLLKRVPEEMFLERLSSGRWRVFYPGKPQQLCGGLEEVTNFLSRQLGADMANVARSGVLREAAIG